MAMNKMQTLAEIGRQYAQWDKIRRHNTVFERGGVLYSYGEHYPLARRYDQNNGVIIVNSNGYSNTTATHTAGVVSGFHAANKDVIYCPDADWRKFQEDRKFDFDSMLDKLKKPRAGVVLINRLREFLENYNEECELLRLQPELPVGEDALKKLLDEVFATNERLKNRYILKHLEGGYAR